MPVRLLLLAILLAALSACGHGTPSAGGTSASAAQVLFSTSSEPTPATPAAVDPVAPAPANPNPLRLPPMRPELAAGTRIFAVSDQMLASARPGSTLVLYAATVAGVDGDDLVVEGRSGLTYRVHPGYIIAVPDDPKLKPGDPVLTEHNGMMKHAVVTKFVRDRIGVRYTDLEGRSLEALLLGGAGKPTASEPSKAVRFVRQSEGLAPGNYAALQRDSAWLHVMLVSGWGEGGVRRWLVLGYGGAAMVVNEADLAAIPVRFTAKPGAVVWAESGGKMRRATVQGAEENGMFPVKFERAGRPVSVGYGLLMAPIER